MKITNVGRVKFAAAQASGVSITISHIVLGDLTDEQYENDEFHTAAETELSDQKHQAELNSIFVSPEDDKTLVFEAIIDPSTRGWNMREVGLLDEDGDLITIGKHPDTFIPVSYDDMIVGEIVQISITLDNVDAVNIITSNAALATKEEMMQNLIGLAASTGIRDLELSEEIGLIKTNIMGV